MENCVPGCFYLQDLGPSSYFLILCPSVDLFAHLWFAEQCLRYFRINRLK